MANLTIRNLDEDVVFALKKRAQRNHRSLEAELRDILTLMSRKPRMRFIAERIASMTPTPPMSTHHPQSLSKTVQ